MQHNAKIATYHIISNIKQIVLDYKQELQNYLDKIVGQLVTLIKDIKLRMILSTLT